MEPAIGAVYYGPDYSPYVVPMPFGLMERMTGAAHIPGPSNVDSVWFLLRSHKTIATVEGPARYLLCFECRSYLPSSLEAVVAHTHIHMYTFTYMKNTCIYIYTYHMYMYRHTDKWIDR